MKKWLFPNFSEITKRKVIIFFYQKRILKYECMCLVRIPVSRIQKKKKKKEKNRLRLPSCDILNIKLLKRFKNPTDNIN